jgi:hypothetical protein
VFVGQCLPRVGPRRSRSKRLRLFSCNESRGDSSHLQLGLELATRSINQNDQQPKMEAFNSGEPPTSPPVSIYPFLR